MTTSPTLTNHQIKQLVDAHRYMVLGYVMRGFTCSLLTFMFRPLSGRPETQRKKMIYEIERCYATMLTRIHRHPKHVPNYYKPYWVGAPDWPVHKSGFKRDHFRNVAPNDGLHFHMLALLPFGTRMREATIAQHIDNHQSLYYPAGGPLDRIHTKDVVFATDGTLVDGNGSEGEDIERKDIVGYVTKSVTRRRLDVGDVFFLPRAPNEMSILSKTERAYERDQRMIERGKQRPPEPDPTTQAVQDRFAQLRARASI